MKMVQYGAAAVEQHFPVEKLQAKVQFGSQLDAALKHGTAALFHTLRRGFIFGPGEAQKLADRRVGQQLGVSEFRLTQARSQLQTTMCLHNRAVAAPAEQGHDGAKAAEV